MPVISTSAEVDWSVKDGASAWIGAFLSCLATVLDPFPGASSPLVEAITIAAPTPRTSAARLPASSRERDPPERAGAGEGVGNGRLCG